jgi:hypothetical protein
MNTKPLTKRQEIGKRRYDRREARVSQQRQRYVRPSDISPPRITDGIPADHAARTVRYDLTPEAKALKVGAQDWLDKLNANLAAQ